MKVCRGLNEARLTHTSGELCVAGNDAPVWTTEKYRYQVLCLWPEKLWKQRKIQRKCAKHGMEYLRGSGIWRLSSKRKKGKSPSFPPPVTPPLRRGEVGEMIPVTPSEAFEWLPHALHRSCSQIQVLQRVCETRTSG